MQYKNKILFIFLFAAIFLSGCKQIFVEKKDPYEQIELSKEELIPNVFYIKDGTKFIQVWNKNKSNAEMGAYWGNSGESVICLGEDYKAVPTLYKNEILAIASTNTTVGDFELTRYKELGYSIGLYGMTMDEEGYLCATLNQNVYQQSNLYQYLSQNAKSMEYRLISINGEPVSTDMISKASGAFNCMQKDLAYQIDYYAGTYYSSMEVVADTFILEKYESYFLAAGNDTKNGYISFTMPEGLKSGWYYIKGYGLFRYIDEKKGVDLANIEMNEAFYTSQKEKISMYSQKFSTTLDTRKTNITLAFTFQNDDLIETESIQGRAYSPDGTEYLLKLDEENNRLLCELKEAMAGKWEIFIQPKELTIANMEVLNNQSSQEITEEEFTIIIDEEKANFLVTVTYEGDGEIYAILVGPDKKKYDLITDRRTKTMSYLASFLQKGIYTIKVYHFTDTNILDIETQEDSKTNSDIITITE